MEHVYLTKKEIDTAYEMKCITRAEKDELMRRVKADSRVDRRNRRKK